MNCPTMSLTVITVVFCIFAECYAFCPRGCTCGDDLDVDCTGAGLSSIPILLNPRTRVLILKNNAISNVAMEELSLYPDLQILDLSFNHILQLDRGAFFRLQKLRVLNLSANRLTALLLETFMGVTNLRSLDVSSNELFRLSTSVFADLRQLEVLNVSSNLIKRVSPGALTGLDKLNDLLMSNNQLDSIPSVAFRSLISLKMMDLSRNGLTYLESQSFSRLHQLETLDLSYNSIESINPQAFHGLISLRQLDLGTNLISHIPSLSFRPLTELFSLHIGSNPIQVLSTSCFEGLSNLGQLVVSYCPRLESIELNAFSGLYNLRTLVLNENPSLSFIDPFAFEQPVALKRLLIAGNHLKSLPEKLIQWEQLEELDVSRNPWKCDCSLSWLPSLLRDIYGPSSQLPQVQCSSPSFVSHQPILQLPSTDFSCNNSAHLQWLIWLAVVLCALGLLTLLVLLIFRFRKHLQNFFCPNLVRRESSKHLYSRSDVLGSYNDQIQKSSRLLYSPSFAVPRTVYVYSGTPTPKSECYYTIGQKSDSPETISSNLSRNGSFRVIANYPVPITEL